MNTGSKVFVFPTDGDRLQRFDEVTKQELEAFANICDTKSPDFNTAWNAKMDDLQAIMTAQVRALKVHMSEQLAIIKATITNYKRNNVLRGEEKVACLNLLNGICMCQSHITGNRLDEIQYRTLLAQAHAFCDERQIAWQ